mmetsp:Transcript_4917/g.13730  ORF Transcript_4917/g.13730 Transcript_4917/m.13730 type:complete len:245 (+) Transcript_4917:643-1377(+)
MRPLQAFSWLCSCRIEPACCCSCCSPSLTVPLVLASAPFPCVPISFTLSSSCSSACRTSRASSVAWWEQPGQIRSLMMSGEANSARQSSSVVPGATSPLTEVGVRYRAVKGLTCVRDGALHERQVIICAVQPCRGETARRRHSLRNGLVRPAPVLASASLVSGTPSASSCKAGPCGLLASSSFSPSPCLDARSLPYKSSSPALLPPFPCFLLAFLLFALTGRPCFTAAAAVTAHPKLPGVEGAA